MYYPYSQRKFDLFSIYLLSEFILLYRFWDVCWRKRLSEGGRYYKTILEESSKQRFSGETIEGNFKHLLENHIRIPGPTLLTRDLHWNDVSTVGRKRMSARSPSRADAILAAQTGLIPACGSGCRPSHPVPGHTLLWFSNWSSPVISKTAQQFYLSSPFSNTG